LEELRRDLEPDLARDLEAVFGARRMVDLLLVRAFDVFRLVEVFRAEVDFFRLAFLCPELFPELFDAARLKRPIKHRLRRPQARGLKHHRSSYLRVWGRHRRVLRGSSGRSSLPFRHVCYSHRRSSSGFRR
jgi:hypothetical protein